MGAALIIGLAVLSWRREPIFANERTLWEATIARNPKAWIASNELGNYFADRGLYEDAVRWYTRCLEIKPDHAKAANNLANVYGSLGRVEDAIREYRRSITLDPGYSDAYFNLGDLYFGQRQYREAVEAFLAAAKINPEDLDVHRGLAAAYLNLGAIDDAIAEYRKVAALKNDAQTHVTLAGLLSQKGLMEEALAEYGTASELEPADPSIYLSRGQILFNLKQYEKAVADWERALSLDPGNERILGLIRDAKDKIKEGTR